MRRKFAFIGAGSLGFTRGLVHDILSCEAFKDAEFALMDIDAKRLEYSRLGVEKIIRQSDCPATVMATMDRAEALKGADGVLITILQGGWMFGVRILRSPKSTAWTYAWATHAAHRESSVFCGRHR